MENTPFQFGISRSDTPSIVRFLDDELRQDAGFSIRDEFPAVFGDFPGGNSLYVESAGRVVSHVAYLTRVFRHPHFHFKVGLIGSVVTAEAFRGHGIASSLLREALLQLKNNGCLFAILWAENPEFYRPLGFERAGQEQSLKFTADEINDCEVTEAVVEFDPRLHAEGVWRLYRQHELTVDRSLQEFKRLCRIPNARIFVTLSDEGGVTSYIVIHKGLDFQNYIHEWGGTMDHVRANVARVQKQFFSDRELTLIAPGRYDLKKLRPLAVETSHGVVGMVKLLDRPRLRALYNDYLKLSGEKAWMGEEWGGDGRSVPTKTDSEFLRAVLGDDGRSAHPVLPFFLWGLDSI